MGTVNKIQTNDYIVIEIDGMQYHVTGNTLKWALDTYLGAHLAWETEPPARPDRQTYGIPDYHVNKALP